MLSCFEEAVLPIEVNLAALRFAKQNDLSAKDYHNLMMDNIDEVADKRVMPLKDIEKEKLWVARVYNKRVRIKDFQIGDLVWKVILPIGSKNRRFGKWSPSWARSDLLLLACRDLCQPTSLSFIQQSERQNNQQKGKGTHKNNS